MIVKVPDTPNGALPHRSRHRPGAAIRCWDCTYLIDPRDAYYDPAKPGDLDGAYYCAPCANRRNLGLLPALLNDSVESNNGTTKGRPLIP